MEHVRIVSLEPMRLLITKQPIMPKNGSRHPSAHDAMDEDPANRYMWYEPDGTPTWSYARLCDPALDEAVVDLPGGLYAVAAAIDEDEQDLHQTDGAIRAWIASSGCFAMDERPGVRDILYRIITPREAFEAMGFRQVDVYVPIRIVHGAA